MLIPTEDSKMADEIVAKIREVIPYHSERVVKYSKPIIKDYLIECEVSINDGSSTSNIIRLIDSVYGININPTLLHKTENGVGEVVAKFKDKKIFDNFLDKLDKSYELEVYKDKCSCQRCSVLVNFRYPLQGCFQGMVRCRA